MNFGQKNKITSPPWKFKTETIKVPRPKTIPRATLNNNLHQTKAPPAKLGGASGKIGVSLTANSAGKKRKGSEISGSHGGRRNGANSTTRRSPSQRPLESDSEEDEEIATPAKRAKPENMELDLKRSLRDQKAFVTEADDDQGSKCKMIHAADVMMTKRRARRSEKVCDRRREEGDVVFLRYPSVSRKERYQLISEGELINPVVEELINPYEEIVGIAEIVKDEYLTEEQAEEFQHPVTGIIRKMERARNLVTNTFGRRGETHLKEKLLNFRNAVGVYNEALSRLTKNGSLAKNLDNKHSLSSRLIKMVLQQVYDRAVSPQVELTKAYENGTDYVYGELTFSFISRILKEDTHMKSDQVFIDLGSGVGNVVIHAALQVGCESWGCEIQPNCCKLASIQKTEFLARCRAWGLSAGSVNLEEGDFMDNKKIHEVIKRADVILVNNQVFSPTLNQRLQLLFLDAKVGCKIVSLKTFVPDGHVITPYNEENTINVLRVEKKTFAQGDVSWQGNGGDYYVATVDRSLLEKHHNSKSLNQRKTRGPHLA